MIIQLVLRPKGQILMSNIMNNERRGIGAGKLKGL